MDPNLSGAIGTEPIEYLPREPQIQTGRSVTRGFQALIGLQKASKSFKKLIRLAFLTFARSAPGAVSFQSFRGVSGAALSSQSPASARLLMPDLTRRASRLSYSQCTPDLSRLQGTPRQSIQEPNLSRLRRHLSFTKCLSYCHSVQDLTPTTPPLSHLQDIRDVLAGRKDAAPRRCCAERRHGAIRRAVEGLRHCQEFRCSGIPNLQAPAVAAQHEAVPLTVSF